MPWYEVTVTGSCLVAVEAANAEEATQLAYDEAFTTGCEVGFKEASQPSERTTPKDIESLRRHADLDLPDDDD